MEYLVRPVGGIESCYVSLPLSLIQNLDYTCPGRLPQVLALELRSPSTNRLWHVAWSGSASSSSAIEVAQQFADCINLPDGTVVLVRALPNVSKASVVTIEPLGEDDWEVMELNAEAAEAAILKQVRIVHETMRFSLWLHGHTIVTFLVLSTVPKRAIVELVPGTEVVVAPKRRRKTDDYPRDSCLQTVDGVQSERKGLLRVQDPQDRLIHKTKLRGHDVGIELTSVALIHPETAKDYLFDPLQVVLIMPRLHSEAKLDTYINNTPRIKLSSAKETSNRSQSEKMDRYAIVRLLFEESVTKGHVMISESLRQYLRAGLQSWIYMQRCANYLKKDISKFSVSPCQFVIVDRKGDPQKNGLEVTDRQFGPESMLLHENPDTDMNTPDLIAHDELVSTLPYESFDELDNEASFPSDAKKKVQYLLDAWFMAQLHVINSSVGVQANSLVLGPKSFLRFELIAYNSGSNGMLQTSPGDSLKSRRGARASINEIFYVLNASGEQSYGKEFNMYELCFGGNELNDYRLALKFLLENVVLEDPLSFDIIKERAFNHSFSSTLSSLSWMSSAASDVIDRLNLLLSPASGMWYTKLYLPFPGHVLIYGPPGSGKTLLASAVAKFLEENDELLAHITFVCCSSLSSEKITTIRQVLADSISDALDHAPSLIIFDDFDSIIPSSLKNEGTQASASIISLTEFITSIMDEYTEKRKTSCGIGPIAFLACVHDLNGIPPSLRASGRFDFHIQLPSPAASERMAILKHEIQKRSLQCSDDILHDIASKCDGYDAYDLAILVDRSIHAAISRFLPSHIAFKRHEKPSLIWDDLSQAMHEFLPVSMRDITKPAPEGNRLGWEDVGGLIDVRNAIKEIIELPSKFPNIFAKCPLRLRSNVLLYGPPGCGKTHVVGAAASAASLRFISIKGPELLNKYIGASEQAVRDIFSKAAAAAPCLLFFDEFDSIAPKRGHDNTGVTDRVVNQFLTELDGVEALTGVFVFAATSRPDLLDAALLRPGRLDRLLFCDFPSLQDRLDILTVLSRKLPLEGGVDLAALAYMTDGFSGADLQALLSDAELAAIQELLDSTDTGNLGKSPVITNDLLKYVASQARPSVSETEKRRLYSIYSQFLDSKKSIAAQSRDMKGKRATLA
ncbi:hypothetical protein Nepgr_004521 [Nepenthes gracilis]|uniref:Peroxisomal ATPase PEX1 n=1 Tax=Nepenthes gracilis TaxID=150966 RepID=A0AAD3XFB6_NEPGR|nr:hypothetical protein Nepgr_004521 [Nepenthes gracilis]